MSGMYLGVNNNVKIRSYQAYTRRMYHNGRNENLSISQFKDDAFLNMVWDRREEMKELIQAQRDELAKLPQKSKSEFSNAISKSNAKVKKYEQELEAMQIDYFKIDDEGEQGKFLKKMERKQRAIENQKSRILELESERAKQIDRRKMPKNEFNELTFNITSLPFELTREKGQQDTKLLEEYRDDLMSFISAQIEDLFPNMKISMVAAHLDQRTPHIHINGMYDYGHTMKQDLAKRFGDKKQYKHLQEEMHKRLMDSELVKKYSLDIVPLKHGEHYIPLQQLKLIETHAQQATKKDLEELFEDIGGKHKTLLGHDYEGIIQDLTQELEKLHYDRLVDKAKQRATKNNLDALEQKTKRNDIKLQRRSELLKPFRDEISSLKAKNDALTRRITKSKENARLELQKSLSQNKELQKSIDKKLQEHEHKILEPYKKELRKQDSELEKLRKVVKENNLEHELEDKSSHHRYR